MAIVRRSLHERPALDVAENPLEGKVVMGIDPGTNLLGYGILKIEQQTPVCLVLGVVRLGKYGDRYKKLRTIFERVGSLVEQYRPDEVALEAPFFGENVQSMLKLGRAQGVAMTAALVRDIPVFEYAPSRVKQAITGRGSASKEQLAEMLQKVLRFDTRPKELDATDGLAVALCHYYTRSSPLGDTTHGGKNGGPDWKSFVDKHPDKIKPR